MVSGAFAGTSEAYVRHRVPYPAALLGDLSARAGITGEGRLLDLACGPGRLTLAIAQGFREVLAIDIEPEMIGAARREAERRRVRNVEWAVGRAEDAVLPRGAFRLVSIGEAFHRLDQPRVAALALACLEPGRCIATLGSYSIFGGREAWQRTLIEVLRRWTSRPPSDQAGLGRKWAPGDPEHHEQVLAAAGFAEVATYSFLEDHAWSLETIMGFLESTSVASKAALGGNGERFASELRAALLSHEPGGVYRERIEWGYTLGRKPT